MESVRNAPNIRTLLGGWRGERKEKARLIFAKAADVCTSASHSGPKHTIVDSLSDIDN